jgi:hypothetical protein
MGKKDDLEKLAFLNFNMVENKYSPDYLTSSLVRDPVNEVLFFTPPDTNFNKNEYYFIITEVYGNLNDINTADISVYFNIENESIIAGLYDYITHNKISRKILFTKNSSLFETPYILDVQSKCYKNLVKLLTKNS